MQNTFGGKLTFADTDAQISCQFKQKIHEVLIQRTKVRQCFANFADTAAQISF